MFSFLEDIRKLDYVKNRFYFLSFSGLIIVIGIILFFAKGGFKQSIDFKGGTRLEVKVNDKIKIEDVRKVVSSTGVTKDVTYVGNPSENVFLISIGATEDYGKVEIVKKALQGNFKEVIFRGEDTVGPRLSQEFFRNAIILSLVVGVLILIYIGIRFDFIFSIGAIVALVHDLLISFTVILALDIEIDISIIAAILTILGYSVTDTVVVYDRIRENLTANVKSSEIEYIVNKSIRQVIVRSVLTSFTTLLIVISIILWGPQTLKGFAITLLVGIISGTYSSLFVSAPIVIELEKRKLLRQEQAL
ncbi:MAG: protein translocase subunit SecF [Brevinematia bacterium]